MKSLKVLQWVGVALLVVGFAGPWVYVPTSKADAWNWQPVWSLLVSVIALNVFGIVAFASCFSYIELAYRKGQAIWVAMLKWILAFFGLLIVVSLVAWIIFDFSERNAIAAHKEGTFGWGLWLALFAQILIVSSLRLQIQMLKKAPTSFASQKIGDM